MDSSAHVATLLLEQPPSNYSFSTSILDFFKEPRHIALFTVCAFAAVYAICFVIIKRCCCNRYEPGQYVGADPRDDEPQEDAVYHRMIEQPPAQMNNIEAFNVESNPPRIAALAR